MKRSWLSSALPIAAIFAFRVLGLFMLIPVFTIYAPHLLAATPSLIGIALGAYGLSQGLLQIPMGMLSDRVGRKTIITIGLIVFGCGSLLGIYTDSIYGMIVARIVQGTGAVGSVLIALLADLTEEKDRTKSMAVIGCSFAASFSIAMVISPIIAGKFGLTGIFAVTACFAAVGLFILHFIIPTPQPLNKTTRTRWSDDFKDVFSSRELRSLNIGIFCQHAILTATFFAVPLLLQQQVKQGHLTELWHFYLPLMLFAFIVMAPLIWLSEKFNRVQEFFIGSVAVTIMCQFAWAIVPATYLWAMGVVMAVYFIGFNFLEATLPSLVSKKARAECKGTAMGLYSSSQFLGIFVGGLLAGLAYQFIGNRGIFLTNGCIGLLWFVTSYRMVLRPPSTDKV